jgi:CPA1 family monovalent cation:H+ antiporter
VTVAAAQTLPGDTPHRALLVLIAFAVAAASLLIQGGTIGPLLRLVAPKTDPVAAARQQKEEVTAIFELLREHAASVPGRPDMSGERTPELFAQASRYRLAVIAAQRSALLDARDNGTFDADVLADALANLDAEEIAIALRGKLAGPATVEGLTAGE